MAKIEYVRKRLLTKSMDIVNKANEIIAELEAEGYQLTLRQLYYQFVARDIFPNTIKSYKRLVFIMNEARLAGLVDWDSLEDRTRNLQGFNHYASPEDYLHRLANNFHLNTREGQSTYLEIWVEKEALIGVVARVAQKWDIDYFACRGYVSQSEQHDAAMRIYDKLMSHDRAIVLHLGDHDPSGIDMTRDIEDRMKLFLGHYGEAENFSIQRLALNMNQVKQYKPPENPAKMTDSRFGGYEALHGTKSWELDALAPKVIDKLIDNAVREHTDIELWESRKELQEEGREKLRKAARDMSNPPKKKAKKK